MNQIEGLLLAGRYRLGECIGRGGMGRVWRAHDEVLHRPVAIKELTAAQYAMDSDRSVLLARTQTEARAAARINHPAVVTVHDVLEHDDRPWIVMELVEGGSLADVVKESGPLEPREAGRVGLWVLRALRAAHAAGVLHRDVKPGNVLLAKDGRVLLTDFGIAQVEGDTTLTKTGEVIGSVDYLAPERVRGADPGPAADLWALGATLFLAVDGRSPFRRGTPLATMQAVVEEEPGEPSGAGALAPVIAALLHKDPAQRPSAADTETMLAEAAEGRKPAAAQSYLTTAAHPTDPTRPHESADDSSGSTGSAGPSVGGGSSGSNIYGTPDPFEPSGPHGPPGAVQPPSSAGHPSVPPGGHPYGAPPGAHAYGAEAAAGPDASGGRAAHGPHAPAGSPWAHPGHGEPEQEWLTTHQPRGAAPPGRLGWRVLAVVLAAAVLVGGGTLVGLHYARGRDARQTGATGPGSNTQAPPSASTTTPPQTSGPPTRRPTTVPEGWQRVHDPEGFSLLLPRAWVRRTSGTQIDYTPDDGDHFVRISVDGSPDFDSPYRHQLDLEEQLTDLPDYQRIRLASNIFRDQPGSVWEFTWTAVPDDPFPGPRHAMEQTYFGRDGVEYAIYISSPEADWRITRKQFGIVLQSWRPGADTPAS